MIGQEDVPAAKRQQILQGAETVFTECGYEGASMSRIACEAGVSKGTLYNYFDSKSTLFAVFVEQKASLGVAYVFQDAGEEEDADRALHAIALRMLELVLSPRNLTLYRIIVSEAAKFPHLAQVFWEAGPGRAVAYLTAWIKQQVAKGRLEIDDPELAAEQFFALCQARIVNQRRLQMVRDITEADIELVVVGAIRLFMRGYGAESLARASTRS